MNVARWQQIQEIFDRAVNLAPGTQRTAVEGWSEGDAALAEDVLKLLEADAREHPLLDAGLEGAADSLLDSGQLASVIQKKIGPYRLLDELGEGGMGVVYLAERTDIGSLVAIKLLRDAWFSSQRRERFASEQRILAQLNHPSIARIYDSGSLEDGTPWFVMEYVAGVSLTEHWKAHRGSIRDRLRLFRAVCDAAQHAHEHAIIHRDLKPSNILVRKDGQVKLLDFGIAKQMDAVADEEKRTVAALAMMTPDYCAPEQRSGGALGVYTDVYALGVILYELLTGCLPFPPHAPSSGDYSSLASPPHVRSLAARTTEQHLSRAEWADLDTICQHALEGRPDNRYRSVQAMMRDIDAFLDGRPLETRHAELRYRTGKFLRRYRAPLTTAAAVLLLAAAAGVFFTVRLARARNAALAEAERTRVIQRFMLNLFGNADGEAAPSNDLKVLTVLDHGVAEADSLRADPETQAELYLTLGSMYNRLGKYSTAGGLLLKAVDRMKQARGAESTEAAGALVQLATLRGDEGKSAEAQGYLDQADHILDVNHTRADDPLRMSAKVAQGRLWIQDGSYQKVTQALEPALHMNPQTTDTQAYDIRDSLSMLAIAELNLHQYEKAKDASLKAIALDRKLLGNSHPQTGVDIVNLASLTATLQDYPAAEKLYREGIATMSAWYGPENPDVLTAQSILARILTMQRNDAEAEAILNHVLEEQQRIYGPVHERVAFTLAALGSIAARRGDLNTAESDYKHAAEIDRSVLGEKSTQAVLYRSELANVYLKEGKAAQAEPVLKEVVSTFAALPAGNNLVGTARARWGRALLALKRYPQADEQLNLAYQELKAQPHPSARELANVCQDLAAYYAYARNPQKAHMYQAELSSLKAGTS